MAHEIAAVTDTKDPNWGLPAQAPISDPNWGLQKPEQPSTNAALIMQGAAKSVPAVTRVAEEIATHPAVPKVVAKVGQIMGGTEAALRGSPFGIAGDAWAGGSAGWFTGKLAQNLAAPVARVLDAVKPYAQTLSTLAGAQAALDLAQIAEPNRKDIGVLGMQVGGGRSDAEKQAHPALLNQIFQALVSRGLSATEAVHAMVFAAHNPTTK